MSRLVPTKKTHYSRVFLLIILIVQIILPLFNLRYLGAQEASDCRDLALIFARGSGQNNQHNLVNDPFNPTFQEHEKESHNFFVWNRQYLQNYYPNIDYKAVSVHDFPGKYSPVGYQAVDVGWESPERLSNSANADASWFPGDYQESVAHGVAETVGYLKDQIAACPDQYFIVGGFSQGAQVMGDSMFQLTDQERTKILGMGLFGDPKYIGSRDGISFPWRRGEATNRDTGMLDPRIPYVPAGMERRTISWCSKHDLVCGGWDALRIKSYHSSYSENPIWHTVRELTAIAAPQLKALDSSAEGVPVPPVQITEQDRAKSRDVMFLLNDDSNDSVIKAFRFGLDPMLERFNTDFSNTRYGAKAFGEQYYGFNAPRVDNIQSLLPYAEYNPSNPLFTSSNLNKSFANRYPSGQYIAGSGDTEDPHQLGLERAIATSNWSQDPAVERNVILFTDRPAKDPYQYDICNGIVRQLLHLPDTNGYNNCFADYRQESWQKVLYPETCESVLLVIKEDNCLNPLKTPSYTQLISRSLEDEIKLAQAYKVRISVVIPHQFTNFMGKLSQQSERNKLKRLADATGGVFIYYEESTSYNTALLNDSLLKVFTKQPAQLETVANGNTGQVLGISTARPTVLDASRGGVVAHSYRWDFDDNGSWDHTSTGPVIEHLFTQTSGIFKVQALDVNESVISETRQVFTASTEEQEPIVEPPAMPTVTASTNADGTVSLSWESDETGQLIVIDPESKLPLSIIDLSLGTTTVNANGDQAQLLLRTSTDDAISDAQTIGVEPYIPPPALVVNEATSSPTTVIAPQSNTPAQSTEQMNETLQQVTPQPVQQTAVALAPEQQNIPTSIPQVASASTTQQGPTNNQPTDKKKGNYNWLIAIIVGVSLLLAAILIRRNSKPI